MHSHAEREERSVSRNTWQLQMLRPDLGVAGQQRLAIARQGFGTLAQLARTRIDEYQRLGPNAQWTFVGVGEGQWR